MEYNLKSSNMHLIGFPEGQKNGENSREEIWRGISREFSRSPEFGNNCDVTCTALV